MRILGTGFGELLIIAISICVLIAWLLAISMIIDACRAKGYPMKKTGLMWFVGIFASPIVIGLYAASLPNAKDATPPDKD